MLLSTVVKAPYARRAVTITVDERSKVAYPYTFNGLLEVIGPVFVSFWGFMGEGFHNKNIISHNVG